MDALMGRCTDDVEILHNGVLIGYGRAVLTSTESPGGWTEWSGIIALAPAFRRQTWPDRIVVRVVSTQREAAAVVVNPPGRTGAALHIEGYDDPPPF
jgi:hypothetical protein